MLSIQDILFQIFVLNKFFGILSQFYDICIPSEIIFNIVLIQMTQFVNVKDINRDCLFEELFTFAATNRNLESTTLLSKKIRFKINNAKREMIHDNGTVLELYSIPIHVDIYTKENYINKSVFDKLYGNNVLQKIVNIVKKGKRPNSKNYERVAIIRKDLCHPTNPNICLMFKNEDYFPLKEGQDIVLISNEFYDHKYRVTARATIADKTTIKHDTVIAHIEKGNSYTVDQDNNDEFPCFIVTGIENVAIKKIK